MSYQKILFLFVICLFLSAYKVLACGCIFIDQPLNKAVKGEAKAAAIVFAGKVVGFEYRTGIPNQYMETRKAQSDGKIDYKTKVVKFEVEKWWKGEVTKEFFLLTDETKNSDGTGSGSSCDYYFKEGENYLVYAFGKDNAFYTHACTRTRLLDKTEDLKILGKGKLPIEKKEKSN